MTDLGKRFYLSVQTKPNHILNLFIGDCDMM